MTGATGFIGSHVAARLATTDAPKSDVPMSDVKVRVLVRDEHKLATVPSLQTVRTLDVVVGDVTDDEAVARALDGCDAVVHAAAHVSMLERETERSMQVNVGGTEAVVGGAVARGARVLYVSSVSVFAYTDSLITIDSPLAEPRGGYTRSKVEAERVARRLQAEGSVAIVYPSGVIGPGDPAWSASHMGLLAWMQTPPRTTSGASIVDVRDVALVIERALGAEPARWMAGGRFLAYPELNATIAGVTGVHKRPVPMPPRLLRAAGRAGDVVKRFVDFEYPLTHEAMVMATSAKPFDSHATCEQLGVGWRPVADTLRDAITDLAAAGKIPTELAGRCAPA